MRRPKTSKPWLGLKPDETKVAKNFVMYSAMLGTFCPWWY